MSKLIGWVCTVRYEGSGFRRKAVPLLEPFFASNPRYIEVHPHHDWKPIYAPPLCGVGKDGEPLTKQPTRSPQAS